MQFVAALNSNTSCGHFDLIGDQVYVNIMDYETQSPIGCPIEAHNRYVDIQVTLEGGEGISIYDRDTLIPKTLYCEGQDVLFFETAKAAEYCYVKNTPGYFTMLFPHEAHRPKEYLAEIHHWVKKYVVKVEVSLWQN